MHAVLSVDMTDAAGDAESDAMHAVQHMHMLKQRLRADGRTIQHGEYRAPEANAIMIIAGTIVQDSEQVRPSPLVPEQMILSGSKSGIH